MQRVALQNAVADGGVGAQLRRVEREGVVVEDVTFIADSDFLLRYGRKFALAFNDEKQVEVRALESDN